MRWFITKKHLVALIGLLVATILVLLLSGCTSTSERSQTSSKRTQIEEQHPTPDGGFVKKTTEYIDGERAAETTTKADVDWGGALMKAGAAAATGDWAALGGVAATAIAAGSAAFIQSRRAKEHKDDANEGWAKYEAAMKDKANA